MVSNVFFTLVLLLFAGLSLASEDANDEKTAAINARLQSLESRLEELSPTRLEGVETHLDEVSSALLQTMESMEDEQASYMGPRTATLERGATPGLASSRGRAIAFTATAGHSRTVSRHARVLFDRILYNPGGHFRNGDFTCPVSGYYFFSQGMSTEGGWSHYNIVIDGRILTGGISVGHWVTSSSSAVVFCKKGSRVWVACCPKTNYCRHKDRPWVNWFTGFYIGN